VTAAGLEVSDRMLTGSRSGDLVEVVRPSRWWRFDRWAAWLVARERVSVDGREYRARLVRRAPQRIVR
jgi:hypothetical protein